MEEKKDTTLQIKLIRHAESRWNAAERIHGTTKIRYNVEYLDPVLTEKGLEQAKLANEILKKEPIDFVFVSPLRRALQTASMLFQDNPGNPKLIAVPTLTEKFGCAGDLNGKFMATKREFARVDFSLLEKLSDPELWYFELLTNLEIKTPFLEKLKEQILLENFPGVGEFVLSEIKRTCKHPETTTELLARVQLTKEFLKNFILENGVDKKYAIVSHATYLNRFTAAVGTKSGESFANCEIKEYSLPI